MLFKATIGSVLAAFDVEETGDAEFVGAWSLTLSESDFALVAPFIHVQANSWAEFRHALIEEAFERTLRDDDAIAALAILLARGTPFLCEVETTAAFWLFHDCSHALHDWSVNLDEGEVYSPAELDGAAEDRAHIFGLELAAQAGYPIGAGIVEIVKTAEMFHERFGYPSEALERLQGRLRLEPD